MRKNCSEIQKFETPEVAQKLPCTGPAYWRSPQYLPAMRTFSESGAKHFFIRPYDIIFRPHELKDMYSIFLRAKRLDLQATKKKKEKETGNGQNFWIASLNANLLHQSKNNKDILSFCWRCQVFWKKKKKRFPCLFQKRCWYQKNVEEGLGIG